MNFTLEQVRHVLAIGRFRHFGRAAEHLGITQPALSHSIKALEERLGCRLFDRSRNGVSTTAEGVAFLERGGELLDAAQRLQGELDRQPSAPRNALSLACGLFPAELALGAVLGQLGEELPDIDLAVEVADWTRARSLLDAGDCQLYFGEVATTSDFQSRIINDSPLRLVGRADHPLARRRRPDAQAVFAYPFVGPRIPPRAAGPFVRHRAEGRLDDRTGWFSPAVVTSSLSVSLAVCAATSCLAVVPLNVAQPQLEAGKLALIRFRAPWLRMNYGFAWHRGEPPSSVAQRFMDLAEAEDEKLQARERELSRRHGCHRWPEIGAAG